MQQRLALARVMCSQPTILLLDEPFSSLHKELRNDLWDLLEEITLQEKLYTLIVSHHMDSIKGKKRLIL
jgi:ABC-type thiamine transport system ATPase subunit